MKKKVGDIRFTSRGLTTPTGRQAMIRYTPFQETILTWIGLLGTATVDQLCLVLARKAAGQKTYLYRILRRMFDLGLVAKMPHLGKDVYFLPKHPVDNLSHAVGVSEVMVRFAVSFKAQGVEAEWIEDRQAVNGLLPDAWAVGEKAGVLSPRLFCFEFQRSKKSVAAMKRKVIAYEQAESEFKTRYQVGGVYRLFILRESYDAFSQRSIREISHSAHGFAFITSDRSLAGVDPKTILISPIWWQAYESSQVPVFERQTGQ